MKTKKLWLFILLFVFGLMCKKKEDNTYILNGKVKGLIGNKIFIEALTETGLRMIDTASIIEGNFSFKGCLKEPVLVNILFLNKQNKLEFLCSSFYLENSQILLLGDISNRGKIIVTGSDSEKVANAMRLASNEDQIIKLYSALKAKDYLDEEDFNQKIKIEKEKRKEKILYTVKKKSKQYCLCIYCYRKS